MTHLDVPTYRWIAELLRRRIDGGDLKPGDQVPPETALTAEYGVARETVRRAVQVLRDEGLVEVKRGRGVYVRRRAEQVEAVVLGPGDTARTRMPSRAERAELGLGEGVPLLVVTRADSTVETYDGDTVEVRVRERRQR